MARETLNVQLILDTLTCERSDDWWGGSEPYLWTVFFKIDGANVRVLPTTQLSGKGTIASNDGSQGNLGVPEMNTGDVAYVPSAVGQFDTTLIPIPVDPPLSATVPDASGVVGAAVILWEQDDFPGEAAQVGYSEFVASMEWAIQEIIKKRNLVSMEPTAEELAALQDALNEDIRRAITRYLNYRVWLGNPDDVIGFELFRFTHDSFGTSAVQTISTRWSGGDGDWVLTGSIAGVQPCPVSAVLGAMGAVPASEPIQAAMRAFRDATFPDNPGLASCWSILEGQSATIARAVRGSQELQSVIRELFADVYALLSEPQRRIDRAIADRVARVLRAIGDSGNGSSRKELARLRPLLAQLEGRTLAELAASVRPL